MQSLWKMLPQHFVRNLDTDENACFVIDPLNPELGGRLTGDRQIAHMRGEPESEVGVWTDGERRLLGRPGDGNGVTTLLFGPLLVTGEVGTEVSCSGTWQKISPGMESWRGERGCMLTDSARRAVDSARSSSDSAGGARSGVAITEAKAREVRFEKFFSGMQRRS